MTYIGYKQTPESIAKRVVANTGKTRSIKQCADMSIAHIGKHHSEETIAKMCASQKIAQNRPEVKAKLSASGKIAQNRPEVKAANSARNIGSNNPAWMGGISKFPYTWEFNDELREEVRKRDYYICQLCNTPQTKCKKNSDPVNLIALCISCNSKVNKNRKHWTTYFQTMAIDRDIVLLNKEGN